MIELILSKIENYPATSDSARTQEKNKRTQKEDNFQIYVITKVLVAPLSLISRSNNLNSDLIFHFFTVACRRQHFHPLGILVAGNFCTVIYF